MSRNCLNTRQVWTRRIVFFSIAAAFAFYSYNLAKEESSKLAQIKLDQARAKQVLAEQQFEDASLIKEARDALLDGFDFGYAVLDEEGRIVGDVGDDIGWNPALVRWTGKEAQWMLGKTLESVMTPDSWSKHQPAFLAAIADLKEKGKKSEFYGKNLRVPCTAIRPSGSELKLTVSARFNLLKNGKWVGQALLDRTNRVINLENGQIDWSDPFTILENFTQALKKKGEESANASP